MGGQIESECERICDVSYVITSAIVTREARAQASRAGWYVHVQRKYAMSKLV